MFCDGMWKIPDPEACEPATGCRRRRMGAGKSAAILGQLHCGPMGPRGCLLVCAVVLGRAGAAECVGWRQTRGCTAEGAREPGGDAGCDVVIPAGRSGFCECSGGNRVGHGCGHTELTCRLECGDAGPSNSGGRCVAWRQTAACDPQGVREPHLDKDCSVMVQSAWSGYCECARGGVAARSGCDHPPFRCEDACRTGTASREDSATQCVGWRQTGHCRDDGPREPAEDLGCGDVVPRAASGYCECVGGVRAGQTGCNHPQFTCEVACARRLRNGPAAAWRDPGARREAPASARIENWAGTVLILRFSMPPLTVPRRQRCLRAPCSRTPGPSAAARVAGTFASRTWLAAFSQWDRWTLPGATAQCVRVGR